jgi:bifunctional pyridoxal-dependent enzyme with beta-cystathionase and maltose regulon repressor activities
MVLPSSPLRRPDRYATSYARLDLDSLEAVFADRLSTMLLCHPHNPLGLIHLPRVRRRVWAALRAGRCLFGRVNLECSPAVMRDAVEQIAAIR